MKYIPSIAFEEMSGSAKGVTAAKVRGRKYIRNRGYGGGFKSSAQGAVKAIFKQLSQNWRSLTNAQILGLECPRRHPEGKERARNFFQDFRGEPLFEAELLDREMRWSRTQCSSYPRRGGSSVRSGPLPHRRQLHLPAARSTGRDRRPQARHYGIRSAEQRCHKGLLEGCDDWLSTNYRGRGHQHQG